MEKDTSVSISFISIVFGILLLIGSPFIYDWMTWEDTDPPIEPIDYNRATNCTLAFIIPGILMLLFGLLLFFRIRNSPKPPQREQSG